MPLTITVPLLVAEAAALFDLIINQSVLDPHGKCSDTLQGHTLFSRIVSACNKLSSKYVSFVLAILLRLVIPWPEIAIRARKSCHRRHYSIWKI